METEEHFFQCPFCWAQISMLVDLSVEQQSFIEDCEVCCRPIRVSYTTEDEQILSFEVERAG